MIWYDMIWYDMTVIDLKTSAKLNPYNIFKYQNTINYTGAST